MPTTDITVAKLIKENEDLRLERDRLRIDLAVKKNSSKTLVQLIASLRTEREKLKEEVAKHKESLAPTMESTQRSNTLIRDLIQDKIKSDKEFSDRCRSYEKLLRSSLDYAEKTVQAELARHDAQDRLKKVMMDREEERARTLNDMRELVKSSRCGEGTSQSPLPSSTRTRIDDPQSSRTALTSSSGTRIADPQSSRTAVTSSSGTMVLLRRSSRLINSVVVEPQCSSLCEFF